MNRIAIDGRMDGGRPTMGIGIPGALAGLVAAPARRLARMGGRPGRYAHFRAAGWPGAVGLEAEHGLGLPISIRLPARLVDDALVADTVIVGRNVLRFDGTVVRLAVAPQARFVLDASPERCRRATAAVEAELARVPRPAEPEGVDRAVARFLAALRERDAAALEDAAERLVGLGLGSTPSGDDVLAAATATLASLARVPPPAAAALVVLRRVIGRSAHRTTPLSAALLRCAADGHGTAPLRACLLAASSGRDVARAVRHLCAVGHSSGYFLATGAAAALSAAGAGDGPSVCGDIP